MALAELRFASTATPRLAQTAPNAIKRVAVQQPPKLSNAAPRLGGKVQSFAFAGRRGVPSAIPRSTNTVGLQSARNFSSTRPVFEHLQNVQLGIRASLNGLDVKDKSSGSGARKVAKSKGKAAQSACEHLLNARVKAKRGLVPAFASHKSSPISSVPSSFSSEVGSANEASMDTYFPRSTTESVRFILPAEPTYEPASFSRSERLLTRSALADLHHVTSTKSLHANQILSLTDRLELAGCLEGHHSQLLVHPSGEKSIVITFDPSWSVSDLKQAVGWGEQWYDIVSPNEEEEEQEMHDVTARSFVMPSPESDVEQFLMDLETMDRPSFV